MSVTLVAVVTVLAFDDTSAFGAFTRQYISQLTGAGTLSGSFEAPIGVAIDSSDDVWVADPVRNEVAEFDSSGNFVRELVDENNFPEGGSEALAVGDSTGLLYVTGNRGSSGIREVNVFNEGTGAFVEHWGEIFFGEVHTAVDNSNPSDGHAGDVYVSEGEAGVIRLFGPSGSPASFCGTAGNTQGNELTGPVAGERFSRQIEPWSMTVDSEGDLYVALRGNQGGIVDEFNSCGELIRAFNGPENAQPGNAPSGSFSHLRLENVAIDPTNGDILISENDGAIYEFRADGQFLNEIPNAASGISLASAGGLAVNSEGHLYIADPNNHVIDVLGNGTFPPDATLAPPSAIGPGKATLNGSVDPEGIPVTECSFEYVTLAKYEKAASEEEGFAEAEQAPCQQPSAAELRASSEPQEVRARITGLAPATYRFRLVVTTNPTDGGGTTRSASATFTSPAPPTVDATSADNLSSTFADLRAEIDPRGANSSYQFEYVPAAEYRPGTSEPYGGGVAPSAPLDIGAGAADVSVLQQVGGLQPGTTYDFRVVASNALGTTPGPNQTFSTLPASGGLSERGYEMLTPPNKGSAEDMFGTATHQNFDFGYASADGEGFLLFTTAAFGPNAASGGNGYVFRRGQAGWTGTSVAAPNLGVQSLSALPDMSDFSRVAIRDVVGSGGNEADLREVTEVGAPGGPYELMSESPYTGGHSEVAGASSNLETVVLTTWCPSEGAPGCYPGQDSETYGLAEWRGGQTRRVDVKTDGSPVSACGAVLGLDVASAGDTHDAISAGGSRIFFTSPDPHGAGAGCWPGAGSTANPPELYVRMNGERTVEVSLPAKGFTPARPLQAAVYVGASADGSRVFFMSESELTPDVKGIDDPELYEYNVQTEMLTRVSHDETGHEAGNVYDVPAISEDGSTVYFTAFGKLTSHAPAVSGQQVDLYRYDTETGATSYIATVETGDYPNNVADRWWELPAQEVALDPRADWYTTPNGRYLVFASRDALTGYDTEAGAGADCPGVGGTPENGHCTEIYRYNAADGSLVCVSCDPDGAAPVSNALFARSAVRNDLAGGPPRAISDDGSYVFFDTADPLVPQDINGLLDVYQWHDGAVSLVSSGTAASDSFFLDASPDGQNVFFGTHAQLVPRDTDSEGDLYDARIGGGEPPLSGFGPCEGDACQTPPAAPSDSTPASLTFSAAASGGATTLTSTSSTRADRASARALLAKALKACRRGTRGRRAHARQKSCEARARKRYRASASRRTARRDKPKGVKTSTRGSH